MFRFRTVLLCGGVLRLVCCEEKAKPPPYQQSETTTLEKEKEETDGSCHHIRDREEKEQPQAKEEMGDSPSLFVVVPLLSDIFLKWLYCRLSCGCPSLLTSIFVVVWSSSLSVSCFWVVPLSSLSFSGCSSLSCWWSPPPCSFVVVLNPSFSVWWRSTWWRDEKEPAPKKESGGRTDPPQQREGVEKPANAKQKKESPCCDGFECACFLRYILSHRA